LCASHVGACCWLPSLLLVVGAVSARCPRLCVRVSCTNSADSCFCNQMRREEHLVACGVDRSSALRADQERHRSPLRSSVDIGRNKRTP